MRIKITEHKNMANLMQTCTTNSFFYQAQPLELEVINIHWNRNVILHFFLFN